VNCIQCDAIIDASSNSLEHLIANAIGGFLKIPGIICRTCNGKSGEHWDSALAAVLHPLSVHFGIKRDRGEVPRLEVEM
jgi:HNH endonuclease